MKHSIIIYGNCQSYLLRDILVSALPREECDVFLLLDHLNPAEKPGDITAADFTRCQTLFQQYSRSRSFPFESMLPPRVQRVIFPPMALVSLWPLDAPDPRNRPEPPKYPFGRFPYGNRLVQTLFRQGLDASEVEKRYFATDIRKVVDLDRIHELALERQSIMDRDVGVAIRPFVEGHFRDKRLFWTHDHPSAYLLSNVLSMVLERNGIQMPASRIEQIMGPMFNDCHVPIHPDVIDHFKLTAVTPTTRYRYLDGSFLTYEEYMQRYISWT